MRKNKIYLGRRRKGPRRTPWFMKKIHMTFTETFSTPVSRFMDQWAQLIINPPQPTPEIHP